MGAGTTAVAAAGAGRHFVGYDTDSGYVEAARVRLAAMGLGEPGEQAS